jgi:hypothetical protein
MIPLRLRITWSPITPAICLALLVVWNTMNGWRNAFGFMPIPPAIWLWYTIKNWRSGGAYLRAMHEARERAR